MHKRVLVSKQLTQFAKLARLALLEDHYFIVWLTVFEDFAGEDNHYTLGLFFAQEDLEFVTSVSTKTHERAI